MHVVIDSRVATSAGVLETGRIEQGNRDCVFQREIPHVQLYGQPFILETGLTAGLESLRRLRSVAADAGHMAIAVAHTHHDRKSPIRANAEDIEMVTQALTDDDEKAHFVGLSRGWPDTVLALKHLPGRAESATAVAPAMMDRLHPERLALLLAEVAVECVHHPAEFPKVLAESVRTTMGRFSETISEALHLATGTIHSRVEDLKNTEQPPKLHMFASVRDCFFVPAQLALVAKKLGFDSFETYSDGVAGHGALAVHQKLARRVVTVATAKDTPAALQ
jgi:pimeloyl-ACP methyl ester carboxylesterase